MSNKNILQAIFNQQRIQIMHLGIFHNAFSDSYLYAWYEGVYPLFSDHKDNSGALTMPHEVFDEYFIISKDKVHQSSCFLDAKNLSGEVLTFKELESRFQIMFPGSKQSRHDLTLICRYLFLRQCFRDGFWSDLLATCPSEEHEISGEFRRSDLDFCS